MQTWEKTFRERHIAAKMNRNLRNALAHCLPLEAGGWALRCVQCTIGDSSEPKGQSTDWHSHNEYQIEIAVEGAFEFTTAQLEKVVILRGQALVIPWKVAHRWTCLRAGLMIGISLQLLPTAESIYHGGWLLEKARKVTADPIKLLSDELIQSGFDGGHLSFRSKITASRLFLLLAEIMEDLMPSKKHTGKVTSKMASKERSREMVAWMIHYLEKNFGMELSLSQMAHEINLSKRQVHRLFLKHAGRSLHDYLLDIRLQQARKLLSKRGTKMQIKEIAFACGFRSSAHFSSCFKQTYGLAPSTLLLDEIALKSGFTVQPENAPKPIAIRKRTSTSAAKKR